MPQSHRRKPSSEQNRDKIEKKLRGISRARTRLLVCFCTLPVYVVAIWVLLNNGRGIDSMMWIYMAVYAGFAVDMSMRHCPACRQQFYVKSIFLNLLSKRCVHCGQATTASDFTSKD